MNALLVSDLHLTALPRDEYRWFLFDWLHKEISRRGVSHLIILGDLTEAKDFHSARLVNRIVDALSLLTPDSDVRRTRIVVLRGNHDGTDPGCAYFRFLRNLPGIDFIETPFLTKIDGTRVLFLPHTRNAVEDWKAVGMRDAELILMHATMSGSVAENGQPLDGVSPEVLRNARPGIPIYSGDVHVPQQIGRVVYIGAPYPIRFGDSFRGRAVLLTDGKESTLPIPSIQRRIITAGAAGVSAAALKGLGAGDQVKVRLRLDAAEYGDWPRAKANTIRACEAAGVELCGLELERTAAAPLPAAKPSAQRTPAAVLTEYCTTNKVPQAVAALGHQLLKGEPK